MSSISSTDDGGVQQHGNATPREMSRIIDWLVAALLVVAGLAFTVGGAFMFSVVDLSTIAGMVADGTLTSTELTDAQLVDVTYGLVWWGGLGLAAVGLLLVAGGIGFLVYRSRARTARAEAGITGPDTVANAIVGAVVSIVTSFVPLSPILGGLVAGYLQGGTNADGVRVGAYSGLVAAAPIAVLFVFLVGGAVVVGSELGIGLVSGFVALMLVFGGLVSAVYLAALGALGGYLGIRLGSNSRETRA